MKRSMGHRHASLRSTDEGVGCAIFLGCDLANDVHAGVAMELLAEGVAGTARTVVRSTVDGRTLRVDPRLVRPAASLTDDEIEGALFECSCPFDVPMGTGVLAG